MQYDSPTDRPVPPHAVLERIKIPAIFLIVVGILNLAAALGLGSLSLTLARMSTAEFEDVLDRGARSIPALQTYLQQARAEGVTPEDMRRQGVVQYGIWAGVALLVALLAVLGGTLMLKRRGYGLAVTAAALTAIPCVSPMGCCLLGEAVGIWALVVLFNSDVRAAFSAAPPPEASSPFPP